MSQNDPGARPLLDGSADGLLVRQEPAMRFPRALLHVAGELDQGTAPALGHALSILLDRGYEHLDVNLRDVTFCDSAGLKVLVDAHERLGRGGGTLLLRDPCRALQILLNVFGLDTTLNRRTPPTGPVIRQRPIAAGTP